VNSVFLELEDPINIFPFGLNGHFTEEAYSLIADKMNEIYLRKL